MYSAVVDAVAREIIEGKLRAGDIMSLALLQQEFAISRTVAREVMR
ncbi:MAG: GntR family transcriptional regulator, partial [Cellulomonas sp.]